uniref:Uncharacterized protein n=1 Tax=Oryza sativa TaxID=4530 RepID=A0A7L7YVQ6_ORYSA|nr:hypothetical protein [Oryza sativa]QOD40708.1 hypothetical protein [Oryza sativa]
MFLGINPLAPHSLRIRRILFEFPFLHLESGLFYLRLIFFLLYSLFISFRFFPLPLSLSSRYSVCINREPFPLYESILFHSNFFPKLPKKNPELDPKLTG